MKKIIYALECGIFIKITILILALFIALSFGLSKESPIQFNFNNLEPLNDAWLLDGEAVTLPLQMKSYKKESIKLKNQLPEHIKEDSVLCFPSNFCICKVYIDQEERFSYGGMRPLPYGNMVGDRICVVQLNGEDTGKTVVIELLPTHTTRVEISPIYFGTRAQLLTYIMRKNAWKIAACAAFLVFVLASLIMAISQKRVRGRVDKVGMLKSYALFSFGGMVWLLSSSELPQLFTDDSETMTLISYFSLAFISVPYAYFCGEVFRKGKAWFRRLHCIGCINIILIMVLYICNIADTYQTLGLTHLYLGLTMFTCLYYIYKESKTNLIVRRLKSAIFILAFFAIIGFALYYTRPTSGYDAVAFGIGFVIFSAILFSITIAESENMIQEMTRLEVYKELAYIDALTQIGNRAAFNEGLKSIIENESDTEKVALIIYDLNELKKANDGIGHQAGDEMLKGIASCIADTFQSVGKSYRIGGDEFATILFGTQLNIEKYLAVMDTKIEEYNATHTYLVSAARGYAIEEVKNITEESIKVFVHEADEAMYQDKKKYKMNV